MINVQNIWINAFIYDFSNISKSKDNFITIDKTKNFIHSIHKTIIEFFQKNDNILELQINFDIIIKLLIQNIELSKNNIYDSQ